MTLISPIPQIVDLHAEQLCVASMLVNPTDVDSVLGMLEPNVFVSASCELIVDIVRDLRDAAAPVSVLSVGLELRRRNRTDIADGLPDLLKLGHHGAAVYYARKVAAVATLRALADVGTRINDIAHQAWDADDAMARALGMLQELADRGTVRADLVSLDESMSQVWTGLNSGVRPGTPTGYRDLDQLTGGHQPGDLIILAARPGVGKTAISLNLAEQAAANGTAVLFISLEMSHTQLTSRLLAMQSGVNGHSLRLHTLTEENLVAVAGAIEHLSGRPIDFYDVSNLTIGQLRARARAWRTQVGSQPALVIVDYLQLLRGDRRSENRVQEVSEISRGLKQLARELGVTVLALSQLSRAVEGRTSKVPTLSDLRESGSLEQDADMVWFIYRDELYDEETDKKGIAEIHIAKQRNGAVGVVPLRFDPATTRFMDVTYRTPEGY